MTWGQPLADRRALGLMAARGKAEQFRRAGRMAEPLTTGKGTLAARSSLTRSRRKLAANDTPAQRGAVTRATGYAKAARERERTAIAGAKVAETISGKRRGGQAQTAVVAMPQPTTGKRPRIADTLRATLRDLAQADAKRIREIEAITGEPMRVTRATQQAGAPTRQRLQETAKQTGSVAKTLRASLRELAQSDARFYRELDAMTRPPALPGSSGSGRKRVSGGGRGRRLPAAKG